MEVVAVDVGGTHARFSLADVAPGRAPRLGATRKYKAADHPTLAVAWSRFREEMGARLPPCAAVAVAGPVDGEIVKFTNSPWIITTRTLAAELSVDRLTLLNDFGAMAHAVAWLGEQDLAYVAGPEGPLPDEGVTTVIGPGTGLGVAVLLRRYGKATAIETEGGHIDFAPLDQLEADILERLRARFTRVSIERIVSGPGLSNLHLALAAIEGVAVVPGDDGTLWQQAIDGSDVIARQALERFVLSFGAAAGDLTLAHGANAVVITGGLSNRILDRLRGPEFHERFSAKGRYVARMQGIPIRLATHPEPGLLGAAAAFAREHL